LVVDLPAFSARLTMRAGNREARDEFLWSQPLRTPIMASHTAILKTNLSNTTASGVVAGLTAVALVLGAVTTVRAQGGTEAQREACTPDAFRLCTMAMPDEKRVENCLRAAGPRLSAACYDVFFPQSANDQSQVAHGQVPSRDRMHPSSPDRMQPPRSIDDDD
jgi:hypothetical protein